MVTFGGPLSFYVGPPPRASTDEISLYGKESFLYDLSTIGSKADVPSSRPDGPASTGMDLVTL